MASGKTQNGFPMRTVAPELKTISAQGTSDNEGDYNIICTHKWHGKSEWGITIPFHSMKIREHQMK